MRIPMKKATSSLTQSAPAHNAKVALFRQDNRATSPRHPPHSHPTASVYARHEDRTRSPRDKVSFLQTSGGLPGMKKSPSLRDNGLPVERPSGSPPLSEKGETRRGGTVSVQCSGIQSGRLSRVSLALRRLPPKGRRPILMRWCWGDLTRTVSPGDLRPSAQRPAHFAAHHPLSDTPSPRR